MKIGRRWYLIYWGFSTFRFRHSVYLSTVPIFDSWDIGPWEIRHFRKRKYKRPTAAPLVARLRKELGRKKGRQIEAMDKDILMEEMKKMHDESRKEISKKFGLPEEYLKIRKK